MNTSLLRLVQKNNSPEKFPFKGTTDRLALTLRWPVKYFLLRVSRYPGKTPIFPNIPE